MAEIVNLNRVKKQRQKAAAAATAAINRAAHGRTKGEKATDSRTVATREALLDGARLNRDGESSE